MKQEYYPQMFLKALEKKMQGYRNMPMQNI